MALSGAPGADREGPPCQETSMDIRKVPIGRNPPHEINVIIEVPLRSDPIKYEFDK